MADLKFGHYASPGHIMRIESKAPTRVDLAGGTLDIWPLYLFHPGALTINAAISRYAHCAIETHPAGDQRIKLVSVDTSKSESFPSFAALVRAKHYRLPLLAEIVKFFRPDGGITLTTKCEGAAGAGIGASSAMAVAICAALDRFTGAGRSTVDWIHISRDAEGIVIRAPTGTQDHYPPAFGGAAKCRWIVVLRSGGHANHNAFRIAADVDPIDGAPPCSGEAIQRRANRHRHRARGANARACGPFALGGQRDAAVGAEELYDLGEQRQAIVFRADQGCERGEGFRFAGVNRNQLDALVASGMRFDSAVGVTRNCRVDSQRAGMKKIQRPDVEGAAGEVDACRSFRFDAHDMSRARVVAELQIGHS